MFTWQSLFCYIGNYLPLPLGEVVKRSEDGEGEDGMKVSQAKLFFYLRIENVQYFG